MVGKKVLFEGTAFFTRASEMVPENYVRAKVGGESVYKSKYPELEGTLSISEDSIRFYGIGSKKLVVRIGFDEIVGIKYVGTEGPDSGEFGSTLWVKTRKDIFYFSCPHSNNEDALNWAVRLKRFLPEFKEW